MSVEEQRLTGAGYALTLTLRNCPETPGDWHRLRNAWTKRMRRLGMVRLHWVTEWQRRGVPHLHCAIWFDAMNNGIALAIPAWIEVAGAYGAAPSGQHGRLIDGPIGWFQYLAKHASRGVKHYQRSGDNIPEKWQEKTGRVWGHSGDWPLSVPRKFGLQDHGGDGGWFRLRRMVRGWRLADARSSGDAWRIQSARRMFREPDQVRSRLKGYREWIPEAVQLRMLANLAERGFTVWDAETGELVFRGAGGGPPAETAVAMPERLTPLGAAASVTA